MKACGIVAEYNPMHNGHIYHLTKAKEVSRADFVVVVMSGNFVQRGEPAILDKWTRSQIAVENGADLVIELPFAYACNSAENFAYGAMGILNGLGVTSFAFGAETGDLGILKAIADVENNPDYTAKLQEGLKAGSSFAKASSDAIKEVLGEDAARVMSQPNNILGVEYLRNCKEMEPFVIERKGAYHGEECPKGAFASAEAIRKSLLSIGDVENLDVPANTRTSLELSVQLMNCEKLTKPCLEKVMTMEPQAIANIFGCGEGLENRLKKVVRSASDFNSLIQETKSKRYTYTAISRLLMQMLIGFEKQDIRKDDCLYARVLAFNEKGSKYLKMIKKEELASIPVITNINKCEKPELMKYDILASDIYNLYAGFDTHKNSDYIKMPYVGQNSE